MEQRESGFWFRLIVNKLVGVAQTKYKLYLRVYIASKARARGSDRESMCKVCIWEREFKWRGEFRWCTRGAQS